MAAIEVAWLYRSTRWLQYRGGLALRVDQMAAIERWPDSMRQPYGCNREVAWLYKWLQVLLLYLGVHQNHGARELSTGLE